MSSQCGPPPHGPSWIGWGWTSGIYYNLQSVKREEGLQHRRHRSQAQSWLTIILHSTLNIALHHKLNLSHSFSIRLFEFSEIREMLTGPHKIVSTSTSKLISSVAVIITTSLYSLALLAQLHSALGSCFFSGTWFLNLVFNFVSCIKRWFIFNESFDDKT